MISIPKLTKDIKQVQTALENLACKDGRIAAFILGLTGSGKSSFVSYMLGAKISFVREDGTWKLSHGDPKCPEIGNTNESCTVIPSIYEMGDLTLYDPPGFLDTKGVLQEILNSYANAKMFRRGAKAKIIMMVQIGSVVSARGGPLVDIAKRLRELFQNDFRQVINSCGLIVSKVNISEYESDDEIYSQVTGLYQKNKNLGPECEMLLRTLVENKRIISYPQPKYIKPEILNSLKNFVKSVPSFVVANDTTVSLSFEAKIAVQQVANQTQKEMTQLSHTIGKAIEANFKREYSKEQLNEALIRVKSSVEMIAGGEIESGVPNKIAEFAQKLSIPNQLVDNLNQLMKRLSFCSTLYPQVIVTKKLSEVFMMYLVQTEKYLESILQKITSKEEREQMEQQHQQILAQQSQQFESQMAQVEAKAKEREEEIRKSIANDNAAFIQMMQESNRQHNEMMGRLTQQLVEIASRPPPESSGGICQIM